MSKAGAKNKSHFLMHYDSIEGKTGGMRAISALSGAFDSDFKDSIIELARSEGYTYLDNRFDILRFLLSLVPNYVYVQDPSVEFYKLPARFLIDQYGDCDDMAIFLAAVLTVLRIDNELVFKRVPGGLHVWNRFWLLPNFRIDIDRARRKPFVEIIRIKGKIPRINYNIAKEIIEATVKRRQRAPHLTRLL